MDEPLQESPFTAPPRATFWQKLGPGGLASFGLAFGSGVLLLFLPVLFRLRQVLRAAQGEAPGSVDLIVVLGRRLRQDRPTAVFEARLAKGAELWREGRAALLLVAGGVTGDASLSEAEAGRAWLMEQGLPASALLVEDRSQHTLENLFNLRSLMKERGWRELILISDPLHLARVSTFARGLGLPFRAVPATACPPRRGSLGWWRRAMAESFLLHWYHTGLLYSRLIGSKSQLERVT